MTKNELKICNLNYLYELSKGDMGFIREMIDVFLAENSGELDSLEKKIGEEDYSQIKQIAHKLRSSIPYVGLDARIGQEIADIEELARQEEDMDKIKSLFKKVRTVCNDALAELKSFKV
jgi:HPt (histidine-containing phosphotransfer) domain-containing protein